MRSGRVRKRSRGRDKVSRFRFKNCSSALVPGLRIRFAALKTRMSDAPSDFLVDRNSVVDKPFRLRSLYSERVMDDFLNTFEQAGFHALLNELFVFIFSSAWTGK